MAELPSRYTVDNERHKCPSDTDTYTERVNESGFLRPLSMQNPYTGDDTDR